MKKIFLLIPYNIFPPHWGAASRIYNLVKHLAENHKITILCNDYKLLQNQNPNCQELQFIRNHRNLIIHFIKSFGKSSQIFNLLFLIKCIKIIIKEKPDYIIAETALSGFNAQFLKVFFNIPYLLDEHNVEILNFERMKRGNPFSRFFFKIHEYLSCKYAFRIFAVSKTDHDFLISKLSIENKKIVIVPNGVDTNQFYPNQEKIFEIKKEFKLENSFIILFFGKLDYIPNYEAVELIYSNILPNVLKKIPNSKFLIVGDSPPNHINHNNIIFTGLVDRIQDFINTSDVVICPLLSGSGTRLKILEAIACGKTVISTSWGAEGLISKETEEFLKIYDDWNKFSEEIVLSVSKKGTKPHKDFIDKYRWENSAMMINNVLEGEI